MNTLDTTANKPNSVQRCLQCGKISFNLTNEVVKYCTECKQNVGFVCYHHNIEPFGKCPDCGIDWENLTI